MLVGMAALIVHVRLVIELLVGAVACSCVGNVVS